MASYPCIRQCEAAGVDQSSSPSTSSGNISDPLSFALAPHSSQGTEHLEARPVYVLQEQQHHHTPSGPPSAMIQTARMPLQGVMPAGSAMMQRPHYVPPYSGYEPFTTTEQVNPSALAVQASMVQVSRPQQAVHQSVMPRTPGQVHKLAAPPWSSPVQEHSPQNVILSPTKPPSVHAPCTIASPASSGESVPVVTTWRDES